MNENYLKIDLGLEAKPSIHQLLNQVIQPLMAYIPFSAAAVFDVHRMQDGKIQLKAPQIIAENDAGKNDIQNLTAKDIVQATGGQVAQCKVQQPPQMLSVDDHQLWI